MFINIIFLCLFLLTSSNAYYINNPGYYHIKTINIHSNNYDNKSFLNCISVNSYKYRESIGYNNLNIVLFLKKKKYTINTCYRYSKLDITKIEGEVIKNTCNLDRDILIKPKSVVNICKFSYYADKKHELKIIGNFQISNLYLTKRFILIFYLNDQQKEIIFNKSSFYKKIILDEGYYNFSIYIKNPTNFPICNCPSLKDGFSNTRFLFAWINKFNKPIDSNISNLSNLVIGQNVNTIENSIINNTYSYLSNIYLPRLIKYSTY